MVDSSFSQNEAALKFIISWVQKYYWKYQSNCSLLQLYLMSGYCSFSIFFAVIKPDKKTANINVIKVALDVCVCV